MHRGYFVSVVLFINLFILSGLLRDFLPINLPKKTLCELEATNVPHSFLCGKKIKIHDAKVYDLAMIEGISLIKARQIREFFRNRASTIDQAVEISGIGDKTLLRLKKQFF